MTKKSLTCIYSLIGNETMSWVSPIWTTPTDGFQWWLICLRLLSSVVPLISACSVETSARAVLPRLVLLFRGVSKSHRFSVSLWNWSPIRKVEWTQWFAWCSTSTTTRKSEAGERRRPRKTGPTQVSINSRTSPTNTEKNSPLLLITSRLALKNLKRSELSAELAPVSPPWLSDSCES